MPGAHVPAWKRLGLQLKRPATEDEVPSTIPGITSTKKRKLSNEFHDGAEEISNRIASEFATTKRTGNVNSNSSIQESIDPSNIHLKLDQHVTGNPKDPIKSSPAPKTAPKSPEGASTTVTIASKPKKRKSVQFSADVRTVDGPEHPLDYSEVNGDSPKRVQPIPSDSAPSDQPPQQKKKKQKPKTSTSTPAASTTTTSASTPHSDHSTEDPSPDATKAYLLYLQKHHDSRQTWKFNKNHQTQILQNVFNLHRITPTYDPAISSYLHGLQGQGARQRLRDSANKIINDETPLESEHSTPADKSATTATTTTSKQTETKMESPSARAASQQASQLTDQKILKHALSEADQAALEATPAWQHRLAKRRRAKAVLEALADSEANVRKSLPVTPAVAAAPAGPRKVVFSEEGDAVASAGEPGGGTGGTSMRKQGQAPKKRSRGRKRRTLTGVPDDDSSSSSSSSSSDSDSDSKPSATKPKNSTSKASLLENNNTATPSATITGRKETVHERSDAESSDSDSDSDGGSNSDSSSSDDDDEDEDSDSDEA